ncbi:hypothetical protein ACWD4G_31860 [Streptomyces sp. NPDC002643]
MAIIDHHDVFVGSTDDAWTFLVLNRPIRGAARILTAAGFTTRAHRGRTLYLLPPETAEDAHERAGIAAYGLMAHTLDFADLAWTTRHPHTHAHGARPEVTIDFHNGTVTAIALTTRAGEILTQHGFTPTPAVTQAARPYALPAALGEIDALTAVVRAETHLSAVGITVRVGLGIPTPDGIPPAPSHRPATPPPPSPDQTPRRHR